MLRRFRPWAISAAFPLRPPVGHELRHFRRKPARVMGGKGKGSGFLDARVPKPRTPALSFGQRCLGAFGNHLPLVLGAGGENMNREPVRGRHVHAHEAGSALHQVRYESDVAGEPVKAGDKKHGVALAAFLQRGRAVAGGWCGGVRFRFR